METKKPFRKAFTEKASRKAIAGILIVTVVLASVAIAVSAQNEGGVGPRAILPGAITSEHLADDAVTPDDIPDSGTAFTMDTSGNTKIGTDAIHASLNVTGDLIVGDHSYLNGTTIKSGKTFSAEDATVNLGCNQVNASELEYNAIPNVVNYTDTVLSTSNHSFNSSDLLNASGQYWNTTITLPRKANLSVAWTAQDAWVTVVGGGNLSVNCTIYKEGEGSPVTQLTYPRNVTIADDMYNNLTTSINFYCPGLGPTCGSASENYIISMQIRSTVGGNLVGIGKQSIVAVAYPAP